MSESSSDEDEPNFTDQCQRLATMLSGEALEALQSHIDTIETTKASLEQAKTSTIAEIDPGMSEVGEVQGMGTNLQFGKEKYWDKRFEEEEEYEWLLNFTQLQNHLMPYLEHELYRNMNKMEMSILVIGCGNSSFSADLYDAGFHNITSIDYSQVVIDKMALRHMEARPEMKWLCMDMRELLFPEGFTFDLIIDKAGMDSMMVDEGDVWNPVKQVVEDIDLTCEAVRRLMIPGGFYLMLSFQQPHFRTKYLSGYHALRLQAEAETVDGEEVTDTAIEMEVATVGAGDTTYGYSVKYQWDLSCDVISAGAGCLDHFLYVMKKDI